MKSSGARWRVIFISAYDNDGDYRIGLLENRMNEMGILEKIMIKRFGRPADFIKWGLHAHGWNRDEWDYASALYMGMKWNSLPGLRFSS